MKETTILNATTTEMYESYMDFSKGHLIDSYDGNLPHFLMNILEDHKNTVYQLIRQDIDGIRKLFKDGATIFLVPHLMKQIEDSFKKGKNVIIHIYDRENDVLIGSICNKEIQY